MYRFRWIALVLLLSMPFCVASADNVFSIGAGWVTVPGSIGPNTGIYGLPANLTGIGCGSENETSCEPTGLFTVDNQITTLNGVGFTGKAYFTMTEGPGDPTISDYVTIQNTASGALISFFSDPNLGATLTDFTNLGVLCVEGASGGNGCIGTFTFNTSTAAITVDAASDSEIIFDPFGFHFDTSDQIRFTGATVNPTEVPEPASLVLLGAGLLAVARKVRKH